MASDAFAATSAASPVNGVGLQDFMKILTSQLNYQDPLKPLDNQEFIAQIAQFTALEQDRQRNDKIDKIGQLLSAQATTQSVGLLGRTVDFNVENRTVSGVVKGLSLAQGEALISIQTGDGRQVDGVTLAQILAVR